MYISFGDSGRESKVNKLDLSSTSKDYVICFEIPMRDPKRMKILNCLS